MSNGELKAQLNLIERLIVLIGFTQQNATIQDPLEYIYNLLLTWEKNIKSKLKDDPLITDNLGD